MFLRDKVSEQQEGIIKFNYLVCGVGHGEDKKSIEYVKMYYNNNMYLLHIIIILIII